jgi:aryl-alcohol dehydrogenase-like predicted oxidoreductase
MEKRLLGKTGIEISPMGLGCWAIGGPFTRTYNNSPMGWGEIDDAESIRAIHTAIDLGITLFDTANNYGAGHSERILGRALVGKRDKVVIATKFGSIFDEDTKQHIDLDPDVDEIPAIDETFIRNALEGSLQRLQTDYLDLYQFHWGNYPAEDAGEIRDILETLVKEGKIRAYGWSTDLPDRARVFASGENCGAIQHDLNVFTDASELLELCEEFDVGSMNKKPLGGALLTGKFTEESTFPDNDLRRGWNFKEGRAAERLKQVEALRDIMTSGGRTMAQAALGWNWAQSDRTIPIPGFKTVAQVQENAGAMNFGPLNDRQVEQIKTILGSLVAAD